MEGFHFTFPNFGTSTVNICLPTYKSQIKEGNIALIFNLIISNQNCNCDPFLTKLGFICVIVLENKLASNAVIQPVSAKQHFAGSA